MSYRVQWCLSLIFVLISSSMLSAGCSSNEALVQKFLELRKNGNTKEAYLMLSSGTTAKITQDHFEKYCFVYKVAEYIKPVVQQGLVKASYKYYDKRFKKGSQELYTFYFTDNEELLKVVDGKIVFPHPFFLDLRNAIEQKNMEAAKKAVQEMLAISPDQPDIIDTAKRLELL